ncbi:hypothetical protein VTN00DRAFT_5928 [Thermoascus crustaceus]|uniref:uncharacterized protein n=1 Tax=Thermoascus crustaceus TaxID=5088 RepID=UPI00374298BA
MSSEHTNSPPHSPLSTHQRRASLTPGASFAELFSRSGSSGANVGNPTAPPPFPSPIATVAANQRRRVSITTLGLSGSPSQTSPFGNPSMRRGSLSSSMGSSATNFEEAVIEENENTPPNNTPVSPFARRVSFGAQALRDVRGGGTTGNGRCSSLGSSMAAKHRTVSSTSTSSAHSSTASAAASTNKSIPQNDRSNLSWRQLGEGFNWSEALRTRAERAPSIGAHSPTSPPGQQSAPGLQGHHQRAASIASMEQPAREMPKQPRHNKPDFFQEKILRADFMD